MFPCSDCLKLANKLATINNEASMRSAVNRAYFAAFHKTKMFAQSSGVKFSGSKRSYIHKDIIKFLVGYNDEKVKLLGPGLDRLRDNRNKCDYADAVNNLKRIAENAVITAKEIFNNIT